ncbi:ATP-binding protein [Streptomyces sp. NBC_01477]|uniref:ATP-binding protein n=1 Tax=Streptomyces sp. NBC_01477 TaxID=2976015 RepID=UPI002E380C31|nr:ATP-binding protein [Streptomyces sp. NBC_01477]
MDQHNGEHGEHPGQDEPFDAFGVRSGGNGGGPADRGALVPYGQPAPDPFFDAPFDSPDDPSAFAGLRPVEPSLFDATAPLPKALRPAREPLELTAGTGTPSGGARVRRIVTPDYVLTINPIDGTEVTACPPQERRTPVARTREERAAHLAAHRPSPPPGPPGPELPLLERDEERERLIRLLARGRSVRVTGASGAGRTALLESVANACTDLAPDGVLWLSGYRRTAGDVLHALYSTVYTGDDYRPSRAELPGLLRETGAVVVVDDLEFGGAALEEVLAAAPECAFLVSASPEVPAPPAESMVEEVFLSGLTRVACVDLLTLAAGRPLEEDETAWAADLWFESEGLPLRFVQAGALLRQRDALRFPPEPDWDDSVWQNGTPAAPAASAADLIPDLTGFDDPVDPAAPEIPAVPQPPAPRVPAADVPLPSLAESAAPADLLASRLSESAREALAFAVALDGECPHPSHLPALVGDTHGDAALGEMTAVGLAVPVAAHYRLAAGVTQQLAAAFTAEGELSEVQAHTAALHYAWWTGHPSVTAARAAAESEAIIAAMAACRDNGNPTAAVLLARTVAPVFAAALHWGAWERALRIGQEAARLSGEVAEEAYFHHELGVLALCNGTMDRARAELEASIALRGALADRQGTVVGRRTLALVDDADPVAPLELLPAAPEDEQPTVVAPPLAVIHHRPAPAHAAPSPGPRRLAVVGTRRNMVAAGTGVLLAAVLGTIVTLGATSGAGDGSDQKNQVKPLESAQPEAPEDTSSTSPAASASSAPASSTAPPPASTAPTQSATAPDGTQGGTASTPPPATSGPPQHSTGGGTSSGGGTSGGTPGGTSGGTSGGTAGGQTGSPSSSPSNPTDTPSGGPTDTPTSPTPTIPTAPQSQPVPASPTVIEPSAAPTDSATTSPADTGTGSATPTTAP